jgi:hypothetical protein
MSGVWRPANVRYGGFSDVADAWIWYMAHENRGAVSC